MFEYQKANNPECEKPNVEIFEKINQSVKNLMLKFSKNWKT